MVEQIEHRMRPKSRDGRTHSGGRSGYLIYKGHLHRQERRRAKRDPECVPCYRRFHGWEY